LAVSANNKSLEFERLSNHVTLRASGAFRKNPERLAERLGTVMSIVHGAAGTVDGAVSLPSSRHGDLTCENVLYSKIDDTLAIVDWSDAKWYTDTDLTRGPYLDLATFVLSVFASGPFQPAFENPEAIARAFLRSHARQPENRRIHDDLVARLGTVLEKFMHYGWDLGTRLRLALSRSGYERALRFVSGGDFR
jgi:hypothetical protein